MLPGSPDISGLWPAAWTMGNVRLVLSSQKLTIEDSSPLF